MVQGVRYYPTREIREPAQTRAQSVSARLCERSSQGILDEETNVPFYCASYLPCGHLQPPDKLSRIIMRRLDF